MATVPPRTNTPADPNRLFGHEEANQPFHVKSAVYTAGTDTITATVGPGRSDRGGASQHTETADTAVDQTPVATATTYYVYETAAGFAISTDGALSGDGTHVLLASVATGATKDDLTITDLRGILPIPPSGGVDVQLFTASGTWNKPSGATAVYVYAIGAGGGGGSSTSGIDNTGGGGGGGGEGVDEWFDADDLGASETVTVGAGGAVNFMATSGDGGDSSFGSHLTASGGKGAAASGDSSSNAGGKGGGHTGGAAGVSSDGGNADFGGGGGGGNQGTAAANDGGHSIIGGGGGGAGTTSGTASGQPGTSRRAGSGGRGAGASGAATSPTAPGGGGAGGGDGVGNGTAGARGEVLVITYL